VTTKSPTLSQGAATSFADIALVPSNRKGRANTGRTSSAAKVSSDAAARPLATRTLGSPARTSIPVVDSRSRSAAAGHDALDRGNAEIARDDRKPIFGANGETLYSDCAEHARGLEDCHHDEPAGIDLAQPRSLHKDLRQRREQQVQRESRHRDRDRATHSRMLVAKNIFGFLLAALAVGLNGVPAWA
jgi:hypothetical protein